ncbi:hypothetical protein [Clostridium beijerinckii]|uniref:Uncharacterized protein n=1 Tax=Clostridium beijerinckii TaxID=1520 RepID=A0A1S8S8H7_CLOBE|nr:hypothetical protein [Clostridium beijerinckii]NRY60039.1 hypothetical protein [Clostridium beijerinckii]OOM61791.1 hypothetical protein CLBCK_21570 [Clostridium beijerinckii]
MKKRFNITGTCIPGKHYMIDTSDKIKNIFKLIDDGDLLEVMKGREL